MRRPRGIRGRLFLAVLFSAAVGIGLVTLGTNLLLRHIILTDADRAGRARLSAEMAALDVRNGRLVGTHVPESAPAEGLTWIFFQGRLVEKPRVAGSVMRDAAWLAAGNGVVSIQSSDKMRLYAATIRRHHTTVGRIVVGISLTPYETTARDALIASLALAGAALVLVVLITRWTLRAALRPVAEMTADAREWSDHDLERRFDRGEPYDEITELAATLDGLLDRVASSLRREQRFSAELSHELRTPLARIRTEAEVTLRRRRSSPEYRDALETILANADHLTRAVDTLVLAAQQESDLSRGRADTHAVIAEAIEACEHLAQARGVRVRAPSPGGRAVQVGVDPDVALRIIQPVVENACRYAGSEVSVTAARNGQDVTITVEDDGPGVNAGEAEEIFAPGVRGSAGQGDGSGAGLGLTLARRLARAVSGDVRSVPHAAGGGEFLVRLPLG